MKELHLILEDFMLWCQSQTSERVEKVTIVLPDRVIENFSKQFSPKEKVVMEDTGDMLLRSRISRMWVNSGIVELRGEDEFEVRPKSE